MMYFKTVRFFRWVVVLCFAYLPSFVDAFSSQCAIDSLINAQKEEILLTSVAEAIRHISCVTSENTPDFYSMLGDFYQAYDTDSSIVAYRLAKEKAIANRNTEQQVISNYKLGRLLLIQNAFQASIASYKENLSIIEALDQEAPWADLYELRSNGNLGVIYSDLGDFNKSLEYFLRVMEMSEETENQRALSYTLNNIGSLFVRKEEPEKAIKYLQRALALKKNNAELGQISETYLNIGAAYYEMKKFEDARIYFDSSYLTVENPTQEVHSLMNIASVLEEALEFDSSLFYQKRALVKSEKLVDQYNIAVINGNIANLFYKMRSFESGLPYVNKSIELSNELGVAASFSTFSRLKARLLFETGNHIDAFRLMDNFVLLNDSIMGVQKAQEFDKLLIVYETEKKEQEIANLTNLNKVQDLTIQQQNFQWLVMLSIAAIILLIVLVLVLILNAKRLKVSRENEIHKQKLLRTQMSPHFISNTLNSIQNFVLANKAIDAASYLARFSKLMREILETSDLEQISLEKEVTIISNYLELQKLRFESRFSYEINLDDTIDPFSVSIPPMITQPFIENCIEHGFRDIDYIGLITINFRLEAEKLILEVLDNGMGIREEINSSGRKSMATKITKERIERAQKPINFLIENLDAPHTGTLVRLEFQL